MEKINKIFNEKNIKLNKYRKDIYNYLINTKEHPDAKTIYNNIKKKYPYIAVATIYNTINLFLEKGLIISLKTKDDNIHYDADLSEHYHFVCEKCNKITDIKDINIFNKDIKNIENNIVNKKIVYFFGICENCLNLKKDIKQEKDKTIFIIEKLNSNYDVNIIRNTIKLIPNIENISINLLKKTVSLKGNFDIKNVMKELKKIGYNIKIQ